MPEKVTVAAALERMTHAYEPELLATLDGHHAILVRYDGPYPEHEHDHDELLLCLQGTIRVTLGGETVTLAPHEMVRIPARTRHAPDGDKGVGLIFENGRIQTQMPARIERD